MGNDVPLASYLRLDEVHVYQLMRTWRDAKDSTLRALSDRLARRRFPKSRRLAPGDFGAARQLQDRAKELFEAMYDGEDPAYNVGLDDASRLSYKRYSAGEGATGSIKVVGRDGQVRPIEELDRSVVSVLQHKAFFNRLMMPAEVFERLDKEVCDDDG